MRGRPGLRGPCARPIPRRTRRRRAARRCRPSPVSSRTRFARPRRNVRSCETKSIVPVELRESLDEHLLRGEIEVVRGLVEDEEIRRIEQHSRHHEARLLAAGEEADLLVHVVAGELERADERAQRRRGRRRGSPSGPARARSARGRGDPAPAARNSRASRSRRAAPCRRREEGLPRPSSGASSFRRR